MKVSYTIVPAGDFASSLHFRVIADNHFDPDDALQQIVDHPTTQPILIFVHDAGAAQSLIESFVKNMKERLNCVLVYLPFQERPTPLWYLFDRVTLITALATYKGTPANEVHLYYSPDDDYDTYPAVAPLGAANTHIYVYTDRERYSDLVAWARRCPYPVGIASRALA